MYGSDAWEGRVSLVCCTVVMHGRGVVACVAIGERHLQLVAGTSLYTCNMQC